MTLEMSPHCLPACELQSSSSPLIYCVTVQMMLFVGHRQRIIFFFHHHLLTLNHLPHNHFVQSVFTLTHFRQHVLRKS